MKSKLFLVAMLVLVSILCLGIVCQGLWTVMPKGMIDFPCFVSYDETRQCVASDMYGSMVTGEDRLQVFLSVYFLDLGGGGCDYRHTASDTLQLDTSAGQFLLERSGDTLLVDGHELAVGETFRHVNYLNLNPWEEYYIEFTNYGVVNFCESDLPPQLVVVGHYESRLSPLKVVPLLLILLTAIIVFVVLLVRTTRRARST
ncbi:MAG: hypothetical protein AB1531_08290 [Chloroflexota bacterium]